MAKFSVGREDDNEGPSSSPRPKKRRTISNQPSPPPPPPLPPPQLQTTLEQIVEDEEVDVEFQYDQEEEEEEEEEEVESERDEQEEEGDNEGEEEEEEEEEEVEEDHQIEAEITNSVSNRNDWSLSDGSISVTLTDPDVLDCTICLEPLTVPVFQCENGHVACSCCCTRIGNKCPSCSWPIGYNRCRAIEKVIEAVRISCRNVKYGCNDKVSYSKKQDHEETCIYAPCSCPSPDCNFIGSSKNLFLHFSSKHSNSAKRFHYNCLFPINLELQQEYIILQEQNEGTVFILYNGIELLGNAVNVCCIGPSSTKRVFSYDLIVSNDGCSLRLQSFTKSMPCRVERPRQDRFLLIPSDFVDSCGLLKLELCIRRHQEFPEFVF